LGTKCPHLDQRTNIVYKKWKFWTVKTMILIMICLIVKNKFVEIWHNVVFVII
jgi:hypothetical protein